MKLLKRIVSSGLLMIMVLLSACQSSRQTTKEIPAQPPISTYAENTLVWRIPTPTGIMPGEFVKERQNELNVLLSEKKVGYTVTIEEYEGERPRDPEAASMPDFELKSFKDSDTQTDLITSGVTSYDDTLVGRYPYRILSDAGYYQPLDAFLQSAKATPLREALPQEDLAYSKYNGTTYGIKSFLPAYKGIAYKVNDLKAIGVNPMELKGDLYDNREVFVKLKKYLGHAPFAPTIIDSYRRIPRLGLETPRFFIVYDRDLGYTSVSSQELFKQDLLKAKSWQQDGLLQMAYSGNLGSQCIEQKNMSVTQYLPTSVVETDQITYQVNDDGVELAIVPDLEAPYLGMSVGDRQTGISSWSKKVEQAQDFLLRLFTDRDIANLIQFGVEGRDYQVLKDGTIKQTVKSLWKNKQGEYYTNQLITYSTDTQPKNKRKFHDDFFDKFGRDLPYGFRFDSTTVADEIAAIAKIADFRLTDLNTVPQSEWSISMKITQLKVDDLDQALADFEKDLKDAGIDRVIAEANRQLAEWRKTNP